MAQIAARNSANRDRNREFIWDYLEKNPCITCGEDDPIVLEFDHRDPAEKVDTISRLALSASLATITAEIAKCDVLCAHCHRRRTAKQFGWYAWRNR